MTDLINAEERLRCYESLDKGEPISTYVDEYAQDTTEEVYVDDDVEAYLQKTDCYIRMIRLALLLASAVISIGVIYFVLRWLYVVLHG